MESLFLTRADAPALRWAAVGALCVALLIQGSAWPRQVGDAVAAMAAMPLLYLLLQRPASAAPGLGWVGWFERVFPLLLPLVPLMQLVPLPPWLWTQLPGRSGVVAAFEAAGVAPDWMPLSLTPASAMPAALFLVCPLVLFYATLRLSWPGRRLLAAVIVAAAVIQATTGLAQMVFGADGSWNLYGNIAPSRATGLFASQNHYPAALYMAVPIVVALAFRWRERQNGLGRWGILAGTMALLAFLLVGVLASRSRAGSALMVGALLLCVLVFVVGRWRSGVGRVAIATGLVAVLPFVWAIDREFGRLQARFGQNIIDDYRGVIFGNTIEGIKRHFPFGSGFGSFVDVYQGLEKPADMIGPFVNFAHDDYLQLVLEGGAVAAVLLALFLVWYLAKAGWAVFDAPTAGGLERRAAAVSLFVILIHSTVEYPLRTGALAAVLAVLCGFLAAERPAGAVAAGVSGRSAGGSAGTAEEAPLARNGLDAPSGDG